MKNINRQKTLLEAKSHLQLLKSRVGNNCFNQHHLKEAIENTESLIKAIQNNKMLIG